MLAALTLQDSRELDAALLEVDRAVPPVRHDDVAALPGHLVVRVDALGRPHPLDRAARRRRVRVLAGSLRPAVIDRSPVISASPTPAS